MNIKFKVIAIVLMLVYFFSPIDLCSGLLIDDIVVAALGGMCCLKD